MLPHPTDMSFSIFFPAKRGSSLCLNYLRFGKALQNCGDIGEGGSAETLQQTLTTEVRGEGMVGRMLPASMAGTTRAVAEKPWIPKDEQKKEEELAQGTILPVAHVAELNIHILV